MNIFLKVKFKTSVKSPKGPNCLLCPDVEGGKGGGTIFWEPWFWGANFENAQNVKGGGGGRNIMIQGWLFTQKLSNYIMIEANPRFLQK